MKLLLTILLGLLSFTLPLEASILPHTQNHQQSFTSLADTLSQACSGPEFRQFDYWIGEWTVRNTDGDIIGHSKISRISAGCAILEEWASAGGFDGKSINFYDPGIKKWRQTWVGGDGMILDLTGNPEEENMTLYDEQKSAEGMIIHRIRWTRLTNGRIEQRWDLSTDDGQHWKPVFLGVYEPARPG